MRRGGGHGEVGLSEGGGVGVGKRGVYLLWWW